jgi:hypothetical protein
MNGETIIVANRYRWINKHGLGLMDGQTNGKTDRYDKWSDGQTDLSWYLERGLSKTFYDESSKR